MDRKRRFRLTFGAWWRATLTLLLIALAGLIIPSFVRASLWPVAGAHEATNVASAPNVPALAPQMAPESAATLIKNSQSNDMPGLFQAGQPHNPALAQAAIASAKQSLAHSADNGPAELNWRASYATPSARHDHAMAYDNVRGVVVLFGGYGNGNRDDTWEWDGSNWVERTPTTSPSERSHYAMAYDSTRGVVVLFGGGSSGNNIRNDTWEWDGQNWVERTPTTSPSPRLVHAMAYDSARGVVVLFGGRYYDGSYHNYNDTWEWDGQNWVERTPTTTPSVRYRHAMAYDNVRGVVVLFGGYDDSNYRNDTWEWDGQNWINRTPTTTPSARSHHTMAYDSARGVVVLFGGYDGSNHNDTWEWDGQNWVNRTPTTMPSLRSNYAMAYDSARGVVVLFGGASHGNSRNDTWEWDGQNWVERTPTTTPSARSRHAMAYDSARGVVVLFGGYDDSNYRNDTWEWDGQNWINRTPTTAPSARSHHTMAYDSARGVVVLFGGDGGSSYNDTWEWDGQNWVERTPTTAPLARFGDAMAYDSARGVVVLFGGYRDGRLNDTWEYGPIVTAGDVVISEVRVSNVRNVSFTVSWLTNAATSGHIRYGSEPNNLNLMADDRRGASTSDETHYVRIDGLSANTTYYFDVLSGDVTDHNDGQNYMLTTGPTLDPPGMDTIYGQVLLADGVTPAEGTIVHVTLEDNDGVPSHGVAAPLSDLVDEDGFWNINLAGARLEDLSGYFYYTPSGDRLKVEAQAGTPGSGCQIVDTANDTPAVSIVLQSSDCTISLSMNILPSWNYIALPVELAEPTKAEDVCDDIDRQGGKTLEIDNWEAGGWHGHICDLPFENFTLAMGAGYFIKATEYSTWSIEGEPVTTPVPLELQEGWNSIAIPHTNAYTAESLCDELISQSVTAVEIDRWYHSGWNGHICGESFNNFEIQPGEAYFVKTTSSGTVIPDEPTVIRQPDPSTSGTEVAPVSPDDIPVGKAMPVRNLRISNLRDTSVTLSWSTDQATTGYVRFAEPADLMPRRAAYDTRGATSSSKTHIVVLDHLTPETTYQIEIVSGGGTTKTIKTISVTTASILERIPQPDTIYGQVFYADGITPATGTIVYLSNRNLGNRKGLPLQDVPHREPGNAILLSALVDSDGYWHANLGNARQIDTADEHTTLLIQAAGHSKTVDIGSLRPAPPLILSPQTRLYLPLITHEDALK